MPRAVPVQIEGQTVLIETDENVTITARPVPQPGGVEFVPPGAEEVVSVDEIKRTFADVKDVIAACCNNLYSAMENIPTPEKFAVEFGVKLGGETGVPFLTKASGEANFKVTVEWKKGGQG
jgi:hypothetical protein